MFEWQAQLVGCYVSSLIDPSTCLLLSSLSWQASPQSILSSLSWQASPQSILSSLSWQASPQHRIRSIQNAQQASRHSSVIFVAPYWNYRISCLKVQLAPLAQDADSEKWNNKLRLCKKKGLSPDLEYFRLPTSKRSRLIIIMPSHCYWS